MLEYSKAIGQSLLEIRAIRCADGCTGSLELKLCPRRYISVAAVILHIKPIRGVRFQVGQLVELIRNHPSHIIHNIRLGRHVCHLDRADFDVVLHKLGTCANIPQQRNAGSGQVLILQSRRRSCSLGLVLYRQAIDTRFSAPFIGTGKSNLNISQTLRQLFLQACLTVCRPERLPFCPLGAFRSTIQYFEFVHFVSIRHVGVSDSHRRLVVQVAETQQR